MILYVYYMSIDIDWLISLFDSYFFQEPTDPKSTHYHCDSFWRLYFVLIFWGLVEVSCCGSDFGTSFASTSQADGETNISCGPSGPTLTRARCKLEVMEMYARRWFWKSNGYSNVIVSLCHNLSLSAMFVCHADVVSGFQRGSDL